MSRMHSDVAPDPVVRTTKGEVRGIRTGDIRRFAGIPFALPPFGDRRFALPEDVPAWDGVRDATAFGPTAPQDPYYGAIGDLLGSIEIPGDDILTVNIWSPAIVPDGGLPVMVWYHGGALERGATALPAYDGAAFARDGIVFVSVGHRVGAEGFSVLEGAPRNLGLADAAAGLRWVQREIAAFGGDPSRITIVGESAGGAIVAALLCRPDTAAIPRAAIIQSGPLDAVPADRAGRVTRAVAKHLGIRADIDAFRAVTPRRLIDARRRLAEGSSPLSGTPGFALAVDPDSLPVSPVDGLREVGIPIVIGTNTDEYRLWFTPEQLAGISAVKLTLARLALRIPGRTMRAYRDALAGATPGELLGQLATDRLLRGPAVRAARGRRAPTYLYEFAWPSPVRDLRAAHAIEIGFVFDRVDSDDWRRLVGDAAPAALAARMHGDWVRFIRELDPGWPAFRGDAPGAPTEPVLRYDADTAVVPLPRAGAVTSLIS